ncbi:hypothetical protein [Cryptosporangium sp. NPDC051539]|uniref:hypothetical protein n=1 Tax=Cryptosporangium sp. NPDC051539 TaxID=3363962 RepID=UPI0037919F2C
MPDVGNLLRDFAARIDAYEPDAPVSAEIEVDGVALTLRAPVVRALAEALAAYHDPRDRGRCDHCGGPRMDENFQCRDCGRLSGLFGRMVTERAASYSPLTEIRDT